MSSELLEKEFEEMNNPIKVMEYIKEVFEVDKILKEKLSKEEFERVEKSLKESIKRTLLTGYFGKEIEEMEKIDSQNINKANKGEEE